MSARQPRRKAWRPLQVALLSLLAITGLLATVASQAHASYYKMLLCAGNVGSNGYGTATNTASPQNPGGIFSFENYCGPSPDPAGNNAFLRIDETQPSGNAGAGAVGAIYWDAPPWVYIAQAGGYTREPNAFNDGWRAEFVAEGYDGSLNNVLMQGAGVANESLGGIGWGLTPVFAPHLWRWGGSYGVYRRFVFQMACVRPAGCDRSNFNAVDANTLNLTLNDSSPSQIGLTGEAALLSGQWVRGTQNVAWNVSDLGSGMRYERLRLDGNLAYAIDWRANCNLDATATSGEFARDFAPCPTGGPWGRAWPLNTATLSDGAHTVQVCSQDYGQSVGLAGTGGETCDARTIHTDNTAPGAPTGLHIVSSNPNRYLSQFGATFSLPPNAGSPITKVHYVLTDAAGKAVMPEQVISAINPSEIPKVEAPAAAGDYQLHVWLEDGVGFTSPVASVPVPRDTTPPAAPQDLSVTPPATPRSAQGFDVRWHDVVDGGSPIDAVHYQVLDGQGNVVVSTKTIDAATPEAIEDLEAPRERGNYTLKMWLEDAEGNVGVATSAPLAYQCVRSDGTAASALSAGLGEQGQSEEVVQQGEGSTLRGKLSGPGVGVGGASVCVFARVVTESPREFLGIAVSSADGSYAFAVPPGASREVSALYRSGSRELASAATVQTVVHPVLRVKRATVYNKHAAEFVGSIPGPDNDEVVVTLQVKKGKGWLAFRRYRTREGGQIDVSYRFNRTTAPTEYLMRAQVRTQSGYPYSQGTSDPLRLVVRPQPAARRRASGRGHPGHRR